MNVEDRPASDPETDLPAAPGRLRLLLLTWYRKHRRDLPWRRTGDPYAIWISETMLQQTTVATAIPYWERFLTRFPDLRTLAEASEQEVLRYWSGLGYYRRARNLQAAARQILDSGRDDLPSHPAELARLPGVGPYTAAAVASIAFGRPAPAVDGNVRRVLSRLTALDENPSRSPGKILIENWVRSLLPQKKPGDVTQALMELGALVCTPRNPACDSCPWGSVCRAREQMAIDRFPKASSRPKADFSTRGLVAILDQHERLLLVQIPPGEHNAGLWTLPGLVLARAESAADLPSRWNPGLGRKLQHGLATQGLQVELKEYLGKVRHTITRNRMISFLLGGRVIGRSPRGSLWCWVPRERVEKEAVTGETRKALRHIVRSGKEADR